MTGLDQDPRWVKFHDANRVCSCCGESFDGVFDIGFSCPQSWPNTSDPRPNSEFQELRKTEANILTDDFCIHDGHYFARAVLPIPIIGSQTRFSYGVWGSLAPENFETYLNSFNTDTQSQIGPFFSWLGNQVPQMNDAPVEGNLHPCDNRARPEFFVKDTAHPLYDMQENGITFDALLDIYDAAGCGVRQHLE